MNDGFQHRGTAFKVAAGFILCLMLVVTMAQTPTQVSYVNQVKQGPMMSDASTLPTSTVFTNCSAAVSAHISLSITKQWTNVASGTCAANLVFNGGSIKPASGQTVTLSGTVSASSGQHIFDISGGGTVALAIGVVPVLYPQWFGAVVDGTTNDDTAMNAALVAAKNGPPISITGTSAVKNVSLAMSGNDRLSLRFAPGVRWNCKNSDNTICVHINASSGNPVITISGLVMGGGDGARGDVGCATTVYGSGLVIDGASAPYLHLSNIETYGFCHAGSAGVLIDGAENSDWIGGSIGWASDYGVQIKNVTSSYFSNITSTGSNTRCFDIFNVQAQFDSMVAQGCERTGAYLNAVGASVFTDTYLEDNNLSRAASTCGMELHGDSGFTINNKFNMVILHLANETAGICTFTPSGGGIVGANTFDQDSYAGTPHAVLLQASATNQKFIDFSGAPSAADGADRTTTIINNTIGPIQLLPSSIGCSVSTPTYSEAGFRDSGWCYDGSNWNLVIGGAAAAIFDSNNTGVTTPWSPVLSFGGASTGITYSSQVGKCYVIGRLVNLTVNLALANKGSATGTAQITGIPAACQGEATAITGQAAITAIGTAMPGVAGTSLQGNTVTLITNYTDGVSFVNDTNITNASQIQFTLTYSK